MIYKYKDQTIEYIVDGTNCWVKDSYLVTSETIMRAFINYLFKTNPAFKARGLESYLREWKAHNYLFEKGLWTDRTKDSDLNINEYWYRRLGYFFVSKLYKCKNEK